MLCVAASRPAFFVRAESSGRNVRRAKLRVNDVKLAIQHAHNICYGFADTPACRVAWDRVEEISSAFARQRERELAEKACEEDPLACREYDV